ncbi:hypothetical protein AO286_21760 [Pseudomonas syringae]|uniref:hypothetical protein n=1 Tax=Pseudomonas syringae group TaxID=136849 RepID=UPI000C07EEA6|nr:MULTISPECIES: hypothetical protein [Pseudomonas syringae group]PHN65675.1 hypothetical protein AO286_21760 [Pseudomonas syringae]RMR17948.1 hypothetical protein ALP89_02142 [Pseudomonas syringae pv. persicae]
MNLPIHDSDVELLVKVVSGTSIVAIAAEEKCTPSNISYKVRRVKERISWTRSMTAEQVRMRAAAVKFAGRSAGPEVLRLIVERDQAKAENEALRKLLEDCSDSLHSEMLTKFGGQLPDDMHPVTRREYDRDMAEIAVYRDALRIAEAKDIKER